MAVLMDMPGVDLGPWHSNSPVPAVLNPNPGPSFLCLVSGILAPAAQLVGLLGELVRCGAVIPGTLSCWTQELRDLQEDHSLAEEVVGEVIAHLAAPPVTPFAVQLGNRDEAQLRH